jgi:hypothetical protein
MTAKRTGLAPAGKDRTTRFTLEQLEWLKQEAIARSITTSSVLREMVDEHRLGKKARP